jgi:hypothetical protein
MAADRSPPAQVLTTLGTTEPGMRNQLLLFRHGRKQQRTIWMHAGSASAELTEAFPGMGHHAEACEQTQ